MLFHAQRALVLAAVAIALFMIAPPTSPVLGARRPPRVRTAVLTTPATPKPHKTPSNVRGIIMSGWTVGGPRFDELVALIDRTELNAVVLDIKDEKGEISWLPSSPRLRPAGAGIRKVRDPRERIRTLKSRDIYVIGRIVVFHDPALANARPDLAVQDTKGGIWKDRKGLSWVDPYSPEAWAYNLDLAREAAGLGFDEIQFDYIRFPSDGDRSRIWYLYRDLRPETEVIRGFLAAARVELAPLGVFTSADVFGLSTLVEHDLGIGQSIELIASEVDYLSLMLYPSHYHKPEYDIRDPEREPYRTVAVSLADAKRRLAGSNAKLRPWLQDFSLAVPYTPIEVRAQIKAVEDAGLSEWLLWNARNRYSEDALRPESVSENAGRGR